MTLRMLTFLVPVLFPTFLWPNSVEAGGRREMSVTVERSPQRLHVQYRRDSGSRYRHGHYRPRYCGSGQSWFRPNYFGRGYYRPRYYGGGYGYAQPPLLVQSMPVIIERAPTPVVVDHPEPLALTLASQPAQSSFVPTGRRRYHQHGKDAGTLDWIEGLQNGEPVKVWLDRFGREKKREKIELDD